jgi:chorismate-pyruvate lyase
LKSQQKLIKHQAETEEEEEEEEEEMCCRRVLLYVQRDWLEPRDQQGFLNVAGI